MVYEAERSAERAVVDVADEQRLISECRAAAATGALCVVSIHNHAWLAEWAQVPEWLAKLAHQCVDVGADAVLVHGAPASGPTEVYHGRPIVHGLGNFVFHNARPEGYPQREVWESCLFEAEFDGAKELVNAKFWPMVLQRDGPHRGFPRAATAPEAEEILRRADQQCRPWGSAVVLGGLEAGALHW